MCIATPMRVLQALPGAARCVDRHGIEARVDVALVGTVDAGDWLLVFHGAARERLDAERAGQIDLALSALDRALAGDPLAVDAAFPDLTAREPQLPAHLRR